MTIKKGDKLYLKGKYGMYYAVEVKSIDNQYAVVKGNNIIGTTKVRVDKLVKTPPEQFQKTSIDIDKKIKKSQIELWKIKESVKDNSMTFKEASEKWGLGESTLRSTIRTNKLVEDVDYWKSGSRWLITEDAMIKVYGYPEEIKLINTKILSEIFKLIKSEVNQENDYFFKQIRYCITYSNTNGSKEDLLGLCVMTVLKKCSWLSMEEYDDFNNVNDFMKLLFKEMKKQVVLSYDDKEFFKLASIIIKLSE